jgi:filamentous hemagglutinin family protein
MKSTKIKLFSNTGIALIAGFAVAFNNCVLAQISPDETLGAERSVITLNVEIKGAVVDQINGGAIRGSNLFHSFSEFNVKDGQRVYFYNPPIIKNILGRVTGNNPSDIQGLLGVNGNANLFILNPNGIIFGKGASLDVSGSFIGSTGNSFVFDNGFEFSATNPQTPPLLTINVPIGIQYGANPGSIINESVFGLRVQPGRTLALIGGDVRLDGGSLHGGGVELGGLGGAGTVGVSADGSNLSLSYPENVQRADIFLNKALVNVITGSGDNIVVNAKNLDILAGSRLIVTMAPGLESLATQTGNIKINATDNVRISGTDSGSSSIISTQVLEGALGNAGNIAINTGSLEVSEKGTIVSLINGQENAGSVHIQASNVVSLSNGSVYSVVQPLRPGNAGNINIKAPFVLLSNVSQIGSFATGQGNAGDIQINAADSVWVSGGSMLISPALGLGNAGNVTIESGQVSFDGVVVSNNFPIFDFLGIPIENNIVLSSGIFNSVFFIPGIPNNGKGGNINIRANLSLTNGAIIVTGTLGKGNSGNIEINAPDWVKISGFDLKTGFNSGLGTATASEGKAGDIIINTNSLRISETGNLTAQTEGNGNAGKIVVNAKVIEAFNGGQITTITGGGKPAGSITLNASERITLSGRESSFEERFSKISQNANNIPITILGSQFNGLVFVKETVGISGLFASAVASSTATAGAVNINTRHLQIQDGAQITVSSLGSAGAGELKITSGSINLDQSKISAETRTGNGGNIVLKAQDLLILRRESKISTNAGTNQAGGDGGNINIDAKFIVAPAKENSDITANAFQGSGGKVTINSAGIFGLKPLSRQELERLLQTTDPAKLDASQLQTSDITAVSQTNPSLNGEINLNTPDIDPSSSIAELPTGIFDVAELVNQNLCVASIGSEFTITGRGGLPTSPYGIVSVNAAWEDWWILEPYTTKQSPLTTNNSQRSSPEISTTIIEAQGWLTDANGNVILTAKPVTVAPKGSWLHSPNC